MMNPTYHFARMRELLEEYEPSRERSLAATKLDECELWLAKCQPTEEARTRDQAQVQLQCPACLGYFPAPGGVLPKHGPDAKPCPGSGVCITLTLGGSQR